VARPVHPWRPLGWFAPPFARNVGHTLPPLEPASTILFPGVAWRGAARSGENETAVTTKREEEKRRDQVREVKGASNACEGENESREWMKEGEKRGIARLLINYPPRSLTPQV